MKVLITGGHFSPALAVIEKLPKTTDVVYVGRMHAIEKDAAVSLEYQEVIRRGISFRTIHPGRLHRSLRRNTPLSLLKVAKGFLAAKKIIDEEKPDVILSFGSYVALPICLVGYSQRIPIILHEQTLETGLTTHILSKIATKICVSWESSVKFFPASKTVLTGNPAFSPLFDLHPVTPSAKNPQILITGGNLGSHAINILIAENLPALTKDYRLVHQTGDAQEFKDFELLTHLKSQLPAKQQDNYQIEKFFTPEELHERESQADLVITRAGANTIGELLILNRPSLVIPIPTTQRQEQKKNASLLVASGLAVSLDQHTTTSESFLATVHAMIDTIRSFTRKHAYEETINCHRNAAETVASIIQVQSKKVSSHTNHTH